MIQRLWAWQVRKLIQKAFSRSIFVTYSAKEVVCVNTPFLDPHNDHIVVCIKRVGSRFAVIEEDVLFELGIDNLVQQHSELIDRILIQKGLKRSDELGVYKIVDSCDMIGEAVWWVALAVSEIYHVVNVLKGIIK